MRKSRNGQVRAFAAITKFWVLLMCFAVVFALVLTTGVLDGTSGNDIGVVQAADGEGEDARKELATDERFSMSDINQMMREDPNRTEMTFSFRLDEFIPEGNNAALSEYTSLWSWGGNITGTGFWNEYKGNVGDFGGYALGGGAYRPTAIAAISFPTPSIFLSLVSAGYTVGVQVSAKIMVGNSHRTNLYEETTGFGVIGSEEAPETSMFAQDAWAAYEGHLDMGSQLSDGWAFSGAVQTANLLNISGGGTSLQNTMNYLTIATYRGSVLGGDSYVFLDETTITFTVSDLAENDNFPLQSDGNGPVLNDVTGFTGQSTLNGVMDDYVANDFGIEGQVDEMVDMVDNYNAPVINLTESAARRSVNVIDGTNHRYAKSVTLTVYERTMDYNGTAGYEPDATEFVYYAGLGGLRFGSPEALLTAVKYPTNSSDLPSEDNTVQGTFGYNGGTDNGYYVWTITDNGRIYGTLTLYFNDNDPDLHVYVYDSGGSYLDITFNIDGIKSGGDDMTGAEGARGNASITDGTRMLNGAQSFDSLTWEWNELYPTFANMGGGADAQVWFYAVQRFDSADAAASSGQLYTGEGNKFDANGAPDGEDAIVTQGFDAIGYSVDDYFTDNIDDGYVFKAGEYNAGTFGGAKPINGGEWTGSGWYRFEFYPMNYAGYLSTTPVVRLVKVDVDTPAVTMEVKYDMTKSLVSPGDEDGDGIISPQENINGVWVGTPLTVTQTFAPSFSGNKVSVMGADGKTYLVYISATADSATIDGIYLAKTTGGDNGVQGESLAVNVAEYTFKGDTFASVKVSVSMADGKVVVTTVYTGTQDKETEEGFGFTVYTNSQDIKGTKADLKNDVGNSVGGQDPAWEDETGALDAWLNILIDLATPAEGEVSDRGGYIAAVNGGIPTGWDRNWYTDDWKISADLDANNNEFYAVYWAVQRYIDADTFEEDKAAFIKEYITDGKFMSAEDETFTELLANNSGEYEITPAFDEDAGYYVIFVVVRDRAGNISTQEFGILVDANEYTVVATLEGKYLDHFKTNPYDLSKSILDENGEPAYTVKRGDVIRFQPTFYDSAHAGAYVPYMVKKIASEGGAVIDTPLYAHPDNNTDSKFVQDGIYKDEQGKYYEYVKLGTYKTPDGTEDGADGTKDGDWLEFKMDRTSVDTLPIGTGEASGSAQLVFSFRRVTTVALASQSAVYNGGDIPLGVTAYYTDGSLAGAEMDGFEPYVVPALPNEDGVVHAGTYEKVTIDRKPSEFYVMNDHTPVDFEVEKAPLTMSVSLTAKSHTFGDVAANALQSIVNFGTPEGLVGADANANAGEGKAWGDLLGATADFSYAGSGYVPVGSYSIIVTLTANDYTVTLDENILEFTITARELGFSAAGEEITYGDAAPATYTVSVLKSAFGFDSAEQGGLGHYQDAAGIAKVFGVEESAVSGDDERWNVELPAAAFAKLEVNSFGYLDVNADDYAITGFNASATEFNNNFEPVYEEGGKVTVKQATVSVSAVSGISLRADEEAELADKKVSFTPNADSIRFDVSGWLVIDLDSADAPGAAGGTVPYNVSTTDHALSTAHNHDGIVNVLFAVNEGGTVSVVYDPATGTFTIQFNNTVQFEVPYGEFWNTQQIYYNGTAAERTYTVTYRGTDGSTTLPGNPVFTAIVQGYYGEDVDVLKNFAGSYPISFTVTGFDGEAAGLNKDNFDFDFVDSTGKPVTALNVEKRKVSVTEITFAEDALTKAYGALDGEIPATAEFSNLPKDFDITLGGITRFARDRGRYDNVGTYDLAWDGSATGSATGSDLSVDIARNFTITGVKDALAAHKFNITAKVIDLAKDPGVSIYAPKTKAYDEGNAEVVGANISVDNTVIFTVDSGVGIEFSAVYWKDGAATGEIGSGLSVMFTVELTGNEARNYTLKEAKFEWKAGECSILPDPVALNRNMFTVTKVYDGNTDVINVTISGAFNGLTVKVIDGNYAGANAADSLAVPTLVVEIADYPYPTVFDGDITLESYFTCDDFTEVYQQENGTGIRISVLGVTGRITPREITLDDITFGEDGRTKIYDGSPVFEVPFEFNSDFTELITGFDAKDVDLRFAAEVASKDVNKDDYKDGYILDITDVVLGNEINYVLGEDLKDGGSAAEGVINAGEKFFITARPLEFIVAFNDAVYSGADGPEVRKDKDGFISGLVEGETAEIGAINYLYARAVVGTDGTTYEAFRYVQTGEGYYDGETYLHDVLASFTITVGGDFDWNNYSFDVTYAEGATEGTYTVTDLFLEKAAVLNPAPVTLYPSLFTITNKEYDATTSATIDFSKAATFIGEDGDYIEFVYTANFENANVGTDKKVSVSSLSLKATDDKYAHIAASYYISSTNTFSDLKANITPVKVTVEFTIPDKTYDGTRFVNMTNEDGGWELKAPLGADGKPVRDTWYVAGEPNIGNYGVNILTANFADADVAMDGDNNPTAQNGTVIGFELVCGALDVANYVLVVDSKDVTYDLYSLATLANLKEDEVNSIEGVIYEGGMWLYLVKEGVTLDSGTYQDTRTYKTAKATGKILPAAVTFTVTIVDKTEFTKDFDDTTALTGNPTYGRVGQTDGDYDYYITLSSGEAGFTISGDDIHIAFAGAAVGAQDVVFTIDAVTGGSSNYVFNDANNSYTVKGGGNIKKFNGNIEATISDGITATYGGTMPSIAVKYSYMATNDEIVITVDAEGNAYVTLNGWKAMFGHDDDDLTADVMTRRYDNVNGEWQQNNAGDYIRITGKFGTPTLLTKEGGDKFVDKDGLVCVNAGTYVAAYLDVKADSFDFKVHTASVTIKAKDLRVYVTNAGEGGNFTADYFVGKLPVPVFGLFMEGEVNDLAAFDTWAAVQKTLRGQFVNGGVALENTDVPTGNYALKVITTTGNYNVIIVTEAGADAAHNLVITIPKLDTTQYKVKTNLKRQYELGADGQGVALGESDLLNATAAADDNNIINITWTDANGNKFDAPPSDVGTYNWVLTVTKKIGGTYDYLYAGEFTATGSFTIEQRKITVSLKEPVSFTYDDGKEHVITKDDLTAKDADGNADEFIALISNNITYLLNGTSCTYMTDAGGYTVVLEFVDSPNYELVNNVGTVYVKAKPITVKVDPASKVYDATNGINGNVGISFTAEGADVSGFSVVYRSAGNVVGAITTPGIYTYTIVSKDPNYTVSGESTGNFNVQISKVTYTKDDIDYVTIAFGSPVAVNYYLNDTAVAQGSGYWNIVDANVQKLAGEDGGLVTNGIIRIEMSNNNGVVSTVPGGVTVTARIPAGVGSDFTLYRVTSSGGLEVVEDYTVANGVVTYTTDYISNLVFVGTAPVAGFPWWIIPIIAAALVLTLALAILIAVLVKLHRAPDPIPVEVTPIDSIMPEPPVPAPAAPVAPVIVEVPAADIAPTVYDAPAAVSKHKQPPIIGIR